MNSMISPNIVALINPATNSEIHVTLLEPTPSARKALDKCMHKQNLRTAVLFKRFPLVKEFQSTERFKQLDEKKDTYGFDLMELLSDQGNEELIDQYAEYITELNSIAEEFTIRRFQAIVNTASIAADAQALIFSEPDSEFWNYMESLSPLEDGLSRFRKPPSKR